MLRAGSWLTGGAPTREPPKAKAVSIAENEVEEEEVKTRLYTRDVTSEALDSDGLSNKGEASLTPEIACCMAWAITQVNREMLTAKQLKALHVEVQRLVSMAEGEVIELGATAGVIKATKSIRARADGSGPSLSVVDVMLRIGQLLCRWGAMQEPEVSFRVGVHIGELSWLALPSPADRGYFGKAVSVAKHLADTAPKDNCVHLLPSSKQMLRVFESMTFAVCSNLVNTSGKTSYTVATWEEAIDDLDNLPPMLVVTQPSLPERMVQRQSQSGSLTRDITDFTEEEFGEWLVSYGVDPQLFGKGQAKTLEALFKEVARDRTSYLVDNDGVLERKRQIVRITLVATSPSGTDHALMIASDVMDDGRTRTRNQKLAVTVPEGTVWQEAVRVKFLEIFGLSEELQREVLSVEGNIFKTETVTSASIPGIVTTYLTHEVRIRVLEPQHEGLQAIGLPSLKSFVTEGAVGRCKEHWEWTPADDTKPNTAESLRELLSYYHIDMEEFDDQALMQLREEVYETRLSTLTVREKELTRNTQIIKVWIATDILSVPHLLVHKSKKQRGKFDLRMKDRPISMRLTSGQSWKQALPKALADRLGLEVEDQKDTIEVDECSYRLCEEVEYSASYPGLKTIYRIHEVTCRAKLSSGKLGLPTGHSFTIVRGSDADNVVTEFNWRARRDVFQHIARNTRSFFDTFEVEDPDKLDPKRRLPAPAALVAPVKAPIGFSPRARRSSAAFGFGVVEPTLVQELMADAKGDWNRALIAARRIRENGYSCKLFYQDCVAAFPELQLYMGVARPEGEQDQATSSGRSTDDEYQRTWGALFSVYWLMRLDIDGAQSFCFGVGSDDWAPLDAESRAPRRSREEIEKRGAFLTQVDWSLFREVLVAAGLLKRKPGGAKTEFIHDEERTVAMLVLTAIHDIMKVDAFRPTVAGRREFCGYKSGETITDHDIALGYLLEMHPAALPSYNSLQPEQQESVKFTQCNMEYNMGWLVQAEAPPGGLFKKFREIIRAGQANPQDVAFYFTHWLTDLAGAEPYPQEGAEKFVLRFPMKVLVSFLRSFNFVQHLSTQTETEVFEEYLVWRWLTQTPSLGVVPTDDGSIAMMRIVVMAQGPSSIWLEAYRGLNAPQRDILDCEFACTGVAGQRYVRDASGHDRGPAFLLYYAPALLQKNAAQARGALEVLAEVFKQARSLWPADLDGCDEVVTIMLDALKELTVPAMLQLGPGEVWALQRLTSKSAQVKKLSMLKSPDTLDWSSLRVLALAPQTHQASLFSEPERDVVFGTTVMASLSEAPPWDGDHTQCNIALCWRSFVGRC